jgi:hypothetical protein
MLGNYFCRVRQRRLVYVVREPPVSISWLPARCLRTAIHGEASGQGKLQASFDNPYPSLVMSARLKVKLTHAIMRSSASVRIRLFTHNENINVIAMQYAM